MSAEVEAVCRLCGEGFLYDPRRYVLRAQRPPGICQPCRQRRAARLVDIAATIVRVDPRFAFARGRDGQTYFVGAGTLRADALTLREGDAVILAVDPQATVEPGKRPRALRLRRAS